MGGAPIPIHYMHDLFSEGTSFYDVLEWPAMTRPEVDWLYTV